MRVCITLGVALLAALALSQDLKVGSKAPAFNTVDLNGKKQSLKTLTAKGPVILFFINADCTASPMYMPFFQSLLTPYKRKANVVGIIDEPKGNAAKWSTDYAATYPLLLDADMKIIKAYKAEASPWAVMVGKSGKVEKVWAGYSKAILTDMNTSLARIAKVKPAKLDLSRAPNLPGYG